MYIFTHPSKAEKQIHPNCNYSPDTQQWRWMNVHETADEYEHNSHTQPCFLPNLSLQEEQGDNLHPGKRNATCPGLRSTIRRELYLNTDNDCKKQSLSAKLLEFKGKRQMYWKHDVSSSL